MDQPTIGQAITTAIQASMQMLNTTFRLLTVSQLLDVQISLRQTLIIVEGRIRAAMPGAYIC